MSKEQIEEILKIVCTRYANGICSVDGKPCEEISNCEYRRIANRLYNADYRKQSELEWIRQDKGKGRVAPEAVCSNCGRDVEYQVIDGKWAFENYCSHCGAKMKGWLTQKFNVERE